MVTAYFFDAAHPWVSSFPGHAIEQRIFDTGILQASNERVVVRGGDMRVEPSDPYSRHELVEDVLGGPRKRDGSLDHGGLLTEWAYEAALNATLFAVVVHGLTSQTASRLDRALRSSSAYRGRKTVDLRYEPHELCLHDALEDRYLVHGHTVLVPGPGPGADAYDIPGHRIAMLESWGFTSVSRTPESFRQLLGAAYDAMRGPRRAPVESAVAEVPVDTMEVVGVATGGDTKPAVKTLNHAGPTLDELDAVFTSAYYRTGRIDDDELVVISGRPHYLHVTREGLVRMVVYVEVLEGVPDDAIRALANDFNRYRYVAKCYYVDNERMVVFETDMHTEGGLVPEQLMARFRAFERLLVATQEFDEVFAGPGRVRVTAVEPSVERVLN